MELRYDLWHLAFANLMESRAPPNFEVQTEVRLTIEPQRADMLLLRRLGAAREDEKAQVLRTLWPRLGLVTILELFSHRRAKQGEATRWLQDWLKERRMKQQDVSDMPGYDEMFQKLVEAMPIAKRLAGLTPEEVLSNYAPEQRLSGLAPEQRLAGLDRDHQALALPIEVLRALSSEYVRSLSPHVQEEIRRRIQAASH